VNILPEYLNAITGWGLTLTDMIRAGERITTMRHLFDLREGINPMKRYVHPRIIGRPPLKTGPLAGVTAEVESFIYWNLGALDWDRVTTKPSKAKLLSLGLTKEASELWPEQRPPF
jgi:aldehyde:ferredoxin oxidoreductase